MSTTDEIKEDIIKLFVHDLCSFNIDISDDDISRIMMLANMDYDYIVTQLYKTIISELYIKYNNL